nr:er membrane protein complex subunit 1 [Quercus suber]
MRLLSLPAVLLLLAQLSSAVFLDEAWNVDYHFALLGEPQEHATLFHQPHPESKASLVYTLSTQGVLGAVHPRDGTLVWRQLLSHNASTMNASFLRAGEGQDIVISGIGSQIAAWSAADGRQAWSLNVPGTIAGVEILQPTNGVGTSGAKDALVLVDADHAMVQRIDGITGAVKWQCELDSTDIAYQISASATEIFAITLHKTMLGYIKIKVISLDPITGHKTDEHVLSSENELATAETIVYVGANSASPVIAWTDAAHSVLKVNIIGTKVVSSFSIDDPNVSHVRLHAPRHFSSLAHFLVHYETPTSHWADVYHIDMGKNKIDKAYSLPKLAGRGAFSISTSDANVYFTRITSDEVTTVSSVSHGVLGKWALRSFGVTSGNKEVVYPIHAISDVSVKGEAVSAVRSAVLVSTGEWILLRDGNAIWRRPELLASTVSAAFATSSEVQTLVDQLDVESHSNPLSGYVHRVTRHVKDILEMPALLASLPQKLVNGFLGTTDGDTSNDAFGFHKIVVCATNSGRLFAIDAASSSQILWTEQIVDRAQGQRWAPVVKSAGAGIVALVHDGQTRLYDATTGASHPQRPTNDDLPAASSHAIKYTLKGGALEAKVGSTVAWHFAPTDGQRIISLVPRPANDPVASIGKVLGDRRVLYKYLSPNVALVATANDATKLATFYVLDTVSGAILYSSFHSAVDFGAPIATLMSENWFAYSFTADSSATAPKGHQLIVGELFESLVPNDRGPLSAASNFSSLHSGTHPYTLTRTYQIPESISKMAVTRTQQGITSRQILAVLQDSNSIVGIPYGVLDPRRPVSRDPTKDEMAEGLTRYAPVIEFDPKWYLNHQREVMGIRDIITSPALIESTSLVFTYGLDVFGTRLSPSFSFDILGKDFNKFQMLATVAALAVATVLVAPLVKSNPRCIIRSGFEMCRTNTTFGRCYPTVYNVLDHDIRHDNSTYRPFHHHFFDMLAVISLLNATRDIDYITSIDANLSRPSRFSASVNRSRDWKPEGRLVRGSADLMTML